MNKKGFTLVEMMVAIAVFSIVMVVAMSALLNVIDANQKAQSIKTAINNVNFALEGISKDMRMGTDYSCLNSSKNVIPERDCLKSEGYGVRYRSPRAYLNDDGTRKYAYYFYDKNNQKIQSCLEKEVTDDCLSMNFSDITSPDIHITNMRFYVLGVSNSENSIGSKTQPRAIITLSGEAGNKEKIKTTFDLQTSISQRTRVVKN